MHFKLLMTERTVPNIRKRNDISATDTSLHFETICISKLSIQKITNIKTNSCHISTCHHIL